MLISLGNYRGKNPRTPKAHQPERALGKGPRTTGSTGQQEGNEASTLEAPVPR